MRFVRLLPVAALVAGLIVATRSAAAPAIGVEKLAAPTTAVAVAPSLTLDANNHPWVAWLETEGERASLRVATWNPAAQNWNAPQFVAAGSDWVVNAMDTPSVTVGANGHATAVWLTRAAASAEPTGVRAHAEPVAPEPAGMQPPLPAPDGNSAPHSSAADGNSGSHGDSGSHTSAPHGDAAPRTNPHAPMSAQGAAKAHGAANSAAAATPHAHGRAAQAHDDAPTRAMVTHTSDGGQTWSAPVALTTESSAVEFVALTTLSDGRVLAAWLDGRSRGAQGRTQLRARVVGSNEPDALVDASVCDCCSLALTAFPDGTALLAYRARRDGEIRDILTARFAHDQWSAAGALPADDWRIAGCPVNGPQLASDGGRVASVWYTAAGDDARVLLSFSSDAGDRFLNPLRLSADKAAGRVAVALLHDGAILSTWVDAAGVLWLRRVSPDFVAGEPLALTSAADGRVRGVPRLALLRDYAGGDAAAEALVVFNREGTSTLTTLRLTIPETELLEAERNCDCAPTADQLQGFPIRGTLAGLATADRVRLHHAAVPGLFPAGEHEFRIERGSVAATEIGRPLLARIERRDGAWWLFNVRFIAAAPR